MTEIPGGTRVDVYWNFHEDCWSVKSMEPRSSDYQTVIDHVDRILINNPEFVVQDSGLSRYRRTGRRNVHAFIRGTVIDTGDDVEIGDYWTWEFYYRPRDERYLHLDIPFVFYEVPEAIPAEWLDPDRVLLTEDTNYGLFDNSQYE